MELLPPSSGLCWVGGDSSASQSAFSAKAAPHHMTNPSSQSLLNRLRPGTSGGSRGPSEGAVTDQGIAAVHVDRSRRSTSSRFRTDRLGAGMDPATPAPSVLEIEFWQDSGLEGRGVCAMLRASGVLRPCDTGLPGVRHLQIQRLLCAHYLVTSPKAKVLAAETAIQRTYRTYPWQPH